MKQSKITAISHYLPSAKCTSSFLMQSISFKDGTTMPSSLIETITGIKERRVAKQTEYNSTLAAKAAKKLFTKNNIHPKEIDLLIFASAGQDILEPATSHIIQAMIKTECPVFDITNACNSFIDALTISNAFIKDNTYKKILITTGEVPTRVAKMSVTDRNDFKKSFPGYTFGDAGTAVLIEKSTDASGIIAWQSMASSKDWDTAMLPGGGSRFMNMQDNIYFKGDGEALKKTFDYTGPKFINNFLSSNNLSDENIDHIFVHQVSEPYLNAFTKLCNLSSDKIEKTIVQYGNVAAATIPLGISLRKQKNLLKKGDTVLLIGLAGGISISIVLMTI